MKTKLIGFIIFVAFFCLLLLSMRSAVKQALPRTGEVEIVGGVYTPYLLIDSTLYFLKNWDESIDFSLANDYKSKAKFELIFANKRLLEMEGLTRKKNFAYIPRLTDSFSVSLGKSINYAEKALARQEEIEELVWLFQESAFDQQEIFNKIYEEVPEDSRPIILNIKKESAEEISSFLKKVYLINR